MSEAIAAGFWFTVGAAIAVGAMAAVYYAALWCLDMMAQADRKIRDRRRTREFMNRPNQSMSLWQRAHQDEVRAKHGLAPLRSGT